MIHRSTWHARIDQPELLDEGAGTPTDVQQNLAEMWRVNRYAGGLRALTQHLYPRLKQQRNETVTIADIGCGAANLGVHLVKWAQRNGLNVRVLAVDIAARNLHVARQTTLNTPAVHLVQADAMRPPFSFNTVDYVISSLVLHHFASATLIGLLQACFKLARCGIIMSDLVRGRLPMLAFHLAQPIFARNALTRHDGKLSIRRSYTLAELRTLAEEAELPDAQVHAHFPWRMTLVVDK